jgi:hypothetical protein
MFWYAITLLLTLLADVLSCRFHQADKDLEILLLKQQLRILERKLGALAKMHIRSKSGVGNCTIEITFQIFE